MILSEETRRWLEVRFFYFCFDLFHIKKDLIDVMLAVEAVAQIGNLPLSEIKETAAKMISDPYFLPTREEIIYLGSLHKEKTSRLAEILETTSPSICHTLKALKKKEFKTLPRLDIKADQNIQQFLTTLDLIKKAGI